MALSQYGIKVFEKVRSRMTAIPGNIEQYCQENNWIEPFYQDGIWWAFPGVDAVIPLSVPAAIASASSSCNSSRACGITTTLSPGSQIKKIEENVIWFEVGYI